MPSTSAAVALPLDAGAAWTQRPSGVWYQPAGPACGGDSCCQRGCCHWLCQPPDCHSDCQPPPCSRPSPRSPGVPISADGTKHHRQRAGVIRRPVGKGRTVTATSPYSPPRDFYDEALDPRGAPREAGGAGLALLGPDLSELARSVNGSLAQRGVNFRSVQGAAEFRVCPVPRVFAAGEWSALEAGLAQRVRALDRFVADVYGPRRAVAEGVVPERVIATSEGYEPAMQGV